MRKSVTGDEEVRKPEVKEIISEPLEVSVDPIISGTLQGAPR